MLSFKDIDDALKKKKPSKQFEIWKKNGILKEEIPELADLKGVHQDRKWHPEGSVWNHTMRAVDFYRGDIIGRWAMLFHDTGKKINHVITHGQNKFPRHQVESERIVHSVMKRIGAPADVIERVAWIARNCDDVGHEFPTFPVSKIKKLIQHRDFDLLLRVAYAGEASRDEKAPDAWLAATQRIKDLVRYGHFGGKKAEEGVQEIKDADHLEGARLSKDMMEHKDPPGGDEVEGKGEIPEDKSKKIIHYVLTHPNLDDSDFHTYVESLGIDPHEAEEVIYRAFQEKAGMAKSITDTYPIYASQVREADFAPANKYKTGGGAAIVYHGTDAAFKNFDLRHHGSFTGAKDTALGIFFSDSPFIAMDFGSRIIVARLLMRNPLVYARRFTWGESGKRVFEKRDPYQFMKQDIIDFAHNRNPEIRTWHMVDSKYVIAWKRHVIRNGYDGIILRDTDMNSNTDHLESFGEPFHDFFIPFSTKQIYAAHSGQRLGKSDEAGQIETPIPVFNEPKELIHSKDSLRSLSRQGVNVIHPSKIEPNQMGFFSPSGKVFASNNLDNEMHGQVAARILGMSENQDFAAEKPQDKNFMNHLMDHGWTRFFTSPAHRRIPHALSIEVRHPQAVKTSLNIARKIEYPFAHVWHDSHEGSWQGPFEHYIKHGAKGRSTDWGFKNLDFMSKSDAAQGVAPWQMTREEYLAPHKAAEKQAHAAWDALSHKYIPQQEYPLTGDKWAQYGHSVETGGGASMLERDPQYKKLQRQRQDAMRNVSKAAKEHEKAVKGALKAGEEVHPDNLKTYSNLQKDEEQSQGLEQPRPQPQIYVRNSDIGQVKGWGNEVSNVHKESGEGIRGQIVQKHELPPLYHVTTNADAVDQEGLVRNMGGGDVGGLGKGTSKAHQGVSTTASYPVAQNLQRDMIRMGQVARQERPFNEHIADIAREDEQVHGLPEGTLSPAAKDAAEWHGYNLPTYQVRGWDTGSLGRDAFNSYLNSRETHGKIENPIFFIGQEEAKKIHPHNTGIASIHPDDIPDEALIRRHPLGSNHLDEVMIHSDVPHRGVERAMKKADDPSTISGTEPKPKKIKLPWDTNVVKPEKITQNDYGFISPEGEVYSSTHPQAYHKEIADAILTHPKYQHIPSQGGRNTPNLLNNGWTRFNSRHNSDDNSYTLNMEFSHPDAEDIAHRTVRRMQFPFKNVTIGLPVNHQEGRYWAGDFEHYLKHGARGGNRLPYLDKAYNEVGEMDSSFQSAWPDGTTEKRNYFIPNASHAWQFAPEEGKSVIMRARKDAHPFAQESTGDWYSKKRLHPNKLEMLSSAGEWHPLHRFYGDAQ